VLDCPLPGAAPDPYRNFLNGLDELREARRAFSSSFAIAHFEKGRDLVSSGPSEAPAAEANFKMPTRKLAPLLRSKFAGLATLVRFRRRRFARTGAHQVRGPSRKWAHRERTRNSTARISELIKAIKEYSIWIRRRSRSGHQAQPGNYPHDHDHKLKHGIPVTRDYAPDLPKVMAYGANESGLDEPH